MSKVSDILANNTHFSVRYIREHIKNIPTSTSPNDPFNERNPLRRDVPGSAASSPYIREESGASLQSFDSERGQKISTPSQVNTNINELPEIASSSNKAKQASRAAGFFSSKCGVATIVGAIGVLFVAAGVVTTYMIMKNASGTASTTTAMTATDANTTGIAATTSTGITSSSTSSSTTSTTSTTTSITTTSTSTTSRIISTTTSSDLTTSTSSTSTSTSSSSSIHTTSSTSTTFSTSSTSTSVRTTSSTSTTSTYARTTTSTSTTSSSVQTTSSSTSSTTSSMRTTTLTSTTTSKTTSTTTTSTTSKTTTSSTTSRTTSTTTTSRTTSTTTTSRTTSTTTTSRTTSTTTTSTSTTTPQSCSGWSWNATGVTVAGVSGTAGSASNQFHLPWNIYLDSSRTLYVADTDNSRVQKWLYGASSGTTAAGTGTNGSSATQLSNPRTVWLSGNNLYVADSCNDRVQMFSNGSLTGVTVAGISHLGTIMYVEIDSYNNIFTTDMLNNTIWKNQSVFASGSSLNGPQGTAVMTNGSILITNTQSHTILQWSPGQSSGTVVAGTNGVSGNTSSTFHYPTSVVADYNGNFWVVDNNNCRVQFFCRTASNTTLGRTIAGGSCGSGATDLLYPVGLALDASRNLYVADSSNHRIQLFAKIT